MGGTGPEVWVATSDGGGLVRADAIVAVQLDDDGVVLAQLADEAGAVVTLVAGSRGTPTPTDFHRQMIRAVAELADASGA
ncbi:MAG: hypothetical protein GEV03_28100, partial [Streptosporangiales bacterium]|nr:hypothetical protein [Streptosporangiales bacterium]